MEYRHTPVMLKEALDILNPESGQKFIDCTMGGGGYTLEIAKKILPRGKIISIDLDESAIRNLELKISELKLPNIIAVHGNFKNLRAIAEQYLAPKDKFDGIVLDLGLSSAQLEDASRGFSFSGHGSGLSMNFGQTEETAESIVNTWSEKNLAGIFKNYGQEKFARQISSVIVKEREAGKIVSAGKLAEIIVGAIPKRFRYGKIHPATKVFQALRIAVNNELENLSHVLPQAANLLKTGGKLVVVSYHSLEDAIVKRYFKRESTDCVCPPEFPICQCGHKAVLKILTNHVLRPAKEEVLNNPRSRSAKLRAAEKI